MASQVSACFYHGLKAHNLSADLLLWVCGGIYPVYIYCTLILGVFSPCFYYQDSPPPSSKARRKPPSTPLLGSPPDPSSSCSSTSGRLSLEVDAASGGGSDIEAALSNITQAITGYAADHPQLCGLSDQVGQTQIRYVRRISGWSDANQLHLILCLRNLKGRPVTLI